MMDKYEIAMNLTLSAIEHNIVPVNTINSSADEINAENIKQIATFYEGMHAVIEKCHRKA
jgi:hypothetical protein